jgi:hypothetical protein
MNVVIDAWAWTAKAVTRREQKVEGDLVRWVSQTAIPDADGRTWVTTYAGSGLVRVAGLGWTGSYAPVDQADPEAVDTVWNEARREWGLVR